MYMSPHFIILWPNPSANPVIVGNTLDKTATTSKAKNILYNNHQEEKEPFKLTHVNDKKSTMRVSLYIHNTLPKRKEYSPEDLKFIWSHQSVTTVKNF